MIFYTNVPFRQSLQMEHWTTVQSWHTTWRCLEARSSAVPTTQATCSVTFKSNAEWV